jgi:hypothetical protein
MGPIGCPEKSVRNYHYPLRNNPEEHNSHLFRQSRTHTRLYLQAFLCEHLFYVYDLCIRTSQPKGIFPSHIRSTLHIVSKPLLPAIIFCFSLCTDHEIFLCTSLTARCTDHEIFLCTSLTARFTAVVLLLHPDALTAILCRSPKLCWYKTSVRLFLLYFPSQILS